MVSRHSGRKKVYGMTGDSGDSGCVSWLAFPLEEWLMQLRRRVTWSSLESDIVAGLFVW